MTGAPGKEGCTGSKGKKIRGPLMVGGNQSVVKLPDWNIGYRPIWAAELAGIKRIFKCEPSRRGGRHPKGRVRKKHTRGL